MSLEFDVKKELSKLKNFGVKSLEKSKSAYQEFRNFLKVLPEIDHYRLKVFLDKNNNIRVSDKTNFFPRTYSCFLKPEIKEQRKKEALDRFNSLRSNLSRVNYIRIDYINGKVFKEGFG